MSTKRMSAILTPVCFFTMAAWAQICVDARNLTGTSDGTATNPFPTVQAGVDAAAPDEAVLVATGTFTEDVRIANKAIQLMGGFAGGSSEQYAGGTPGDFETRNPQETPTTLMGTGAESVVTLLDAGASVVDGFIITGGGGSTEDLPYASNGGGIFVRGGAPALRNNVVEANDPTRPGDVTTFGGGIYSEAADVTIEANVIAENTAQRGAGVAAFGGTIAIVNNTIRGNVGTGDHGGGIYVGSPNATISHNRIYENEIGRSLGYGWGAGVLIFNPGNHAELSHNEIFRNFAAGLGAGVFVDDGATAVLRNERIYQNEVNPAQVGGGAVYVDGGTVNEEPVGSEVTLINCTIADNPVPDAYLGGNGLFVENNSTVTIRNSIFWGNELEIWFDNTSTVVATYSNIAGGFEGIGNLSQDPRFADSPAGDLHLMSVAGRWDATANGGLGGFVTDTATSPCIDAGDPADSFANEVPPNGQRINMGAYGNTSEASLSVDGGPGNPADLNGDNVVDAVDIQRVINAALGIGPAADVDGDGDTNAVDVQLVINAALGL